MLIMMRYIFLLGALLMPLQNTLAVDLSQVPENQRSSAGLYFTPREAFFYLDKNLKTTLFLDVRDPAEIFTVGMPKNVDANVPFKRVNFSRWDEKTSRFKFEPNPKFVQEVQARLKAKHLKRNSTIVLICASGIRSAQAASMLHDAGYPHVYSVIDGYAGWRKDKLDWTKQLDRDKMFGISH